MPTSTRDASAQDAAKAEWAERIAELAAQDAPAALAACHQAIEFFAEDPRFYRARIKVLMGLGREAETEPDLRKVVALEPGHVKSMIRLARLCEQRGGYSEAIALLRSALAVEPNSVPLCLRLGGLLSRLGDHDGAAAQYKQAAIHDSSERIIELLTGAVQRRDADLQAGVTPVAKRLCLDGAERLFASEPAQAQACFQEAARLCPAYANARLGLRGARHAQAFGGPCPDPSDDGLPPDQNSCVSPAFVHRPLSKRGLLFDPEYRFPIRSKEEILEKVDTPEALHVKDNAFLVLDPGGRIIAHTSGTFINNGTDATVLQYKSPESFMMSLKNAAIVGRGAVITETNEIIRDISFQHTPSDKYLAKIKKSKFSFDRSLAGDGVCAIRAFESPALLMAGPRDRSFGDWIINFPPRLVLAAAVGLDCAVVVSADIPGQYLDMLGALGVPRDRILTHDPAGVSVFQKLYVPSWPRAERLRPMPGAMDIYRRAALRPSGRQLKLYLSRQDISHRSLVNEDEIRELFVRRGFEVIYPERLNFAETQAAFASAVCVAGPYGSAMRNLVFCNQSPVALALMPPYANAFMQGTKLWLAELGARLVLATGQAASGMGIEHDPNEHSWIIDRADVAKAIDETLELLARG